MVCSNNTMKKVSTLTRNFMKVESNYSIYMNQFGNKRPDGASDRV